MNSNPTPETNPAWTVFLESVRSHLQKLKDDGCSDPYFRGHRHADWVLLPELGRPPINTITDLENRLFHRFRALGSHLYSQVATTWDQLFLMRHHGLPTRLLDWTENFAVALYFAVIGASSDSAIWILDPYALNAKTFNDEGVVHLNSEFPNGYVYHFLDDSPTILPFSPPILAVEGSGLISRMQSQRSAFTLHRDLTTLIDVAFPDVVKKFVLPLPAHASAREFLDLAGINEFSIYPDLDGLSRYLRVAEQNETILPGGGGRI